MSLIKYVWVVQDPTPSSELIDILWKATPKELGLIAKGTTNTRIFDSWRFYDNEREAAKDAENRMRFGGLSGVMSKRAIGKVAARYLGRG